MTISDTWVEGAGWNQSAFKALFVNHNALRLVRVEGVPRCSRGLEQRWIDNYGYSVRLTHYIYNYISDFGAPP